MPDVGVARIADTADGREKILPVEIAGYPLDEQGHLLVPVEDAELGAVTERLFTERARVDGLDGGQEVFQSALAGSLIRAKDAFIFPGEGIAEIVFEEA